MTQTDDERAPDPASALAIIRDQRRRTLGTIPSNALIFTVWGVVWLVAYGYRWLDTRDGGAASVASGIVLGVGILVGLAVTALHITTRTRGVAGTGPRQGALYGLAWVVGYAGYGMLVGGLSRAGASDEVVTLAADGGGALVVGFLFLAGGMMWRSTSMYVLGAWMCLVGGAAALVGLPGTSLVMALAGGGGMLVMGGVEARRVRRA